MTEEWLKNQIALLLERIAQLKADNDRFVSALDNQMVSTHLGVFEPNDDPVIALNKLMRWSQGLGEFFAKDRIKGLEDKLATYESITSGNTQLIETMEHRIKQLETDCTWLTSCIDSIQIATIQQAGVIKMNSCYSCKHYDSHKEIESYEMPHICWYIHSFDARPANANLIQFPFRNTKCKQFSIKRITSLTPTEHELISC